MHLNSAGMIPLISVHITKGVPSGTAITCMLATVGLLISEANLLKKVMTMILFAIYFSVLTFLFSFSLPF
jgi:uncharacterized membrane protein YraQ (UPF0718 family)